MLHNLKLFYVRISLKSALRFQLCSFSQSTWIIKIILFFWKVFCLLWTKSQLSRPDRIVFYDVTVLLSVGFLTVSNAHVLCVCQDELSSFSAAGSAGVWGECVRASELFTEALGSAGGVTHQSDSESWQHTGSTRPSRRPRRHWGDSSLAVCNPIPTLCDECLLIYVCRLCFRACSQNSVSSKAKSNSAGRSWKPI